MVGKQVKINIIGISIIEVLKRISLKKKKLSKNKEAGEAKKDRVSRNVFMKLEKRYKIKKGETMPDTINIVYRL